MSKKVAFTLLLLLAVFAILGPLLHSPTDIHLALKNTPPGSLFWLGSDDLGRDLFARLAYGTAISLSIGLLAALIDLVIGALYGAIAGPTLMRIADLISAVPTLLKVILLTVLLGPGYKTILIALALTGWIPMARIVRSQVLSLRSQEFILGARAIGVGPTRLLFRYYLPNAIGPILATLTLTIPSAIFTEAYLSFLGLGLQPPLPSLGTLISDGLSALRYYPWRLFFPAATLTLAMLSLHLLGNTLRDDLDPRLR